MTNYVHLVIELSVEDGLGNMMRPKNDSDPFFFFLFIIKMVSYMIPAIKKKIEQKKILGRNFTKIGTGNISVLRRLPEGRT